MADTATDRARREARRKKILENSDNRLQKITGKYKEKTCEENLSNNVSYSLPKVDGSISSKILTPESKSILEEKHLNFLEQDNSFDIRDYEFDDTSVMFKKSNNHYPSDYTTFHSDKTKKELIDSLHSNLVNSQQNLVPKKSQDSIVFTVLSSPLYSIFLAAFMNVLLLTNIDFSLYKGLIMPYLLIAITRLFIYYKAEESQETSMLVAALILCNIKPEVVHTFKKVSRLVSIFSRDFVLYITSFTLFNWLISLCWKNKNSSYFF